MIIYYASINFRDVMLASGKLSIDAAAKGRTNQVGFRNGVLVKRNYGYYSLKF